MQKTLLEVLIIIYLNNKMGIFNEHSSNQHQFARGIQGAPGVGFNLTADGNYDMVGKKLKNVGAPESDTDSATKKYVDENSGGEKTSLLTIDSNIDMKDSFRILNLKVPSDADEPATKNYTDSYFFYINGSKPMTGDINMNNNKIEGLKKTTGNNDAANKKYVDDSKVLGSVFLKLDGTRLMTGNLNMNNNRIFNIPAPNAPNQPTPLAYTDLAYLHVDGSNKMTNDLNMDNQKIINLKPPTSNSDAATKFYVDHKSTPQDLSPYFKRDGSVPMTGSLNMSGHKIINLEEPASDNDAVNKKYIVNHSHTAQIQPSHYKDEFSYLMSDASQRTNEITTGTSFNMKKIADLAPSKGNFHDYNHKVIYMEIVKNSQGGYKYKMGINFYRLPKTFDNTLCLEILNIDYELWHKSQISVDRGTSRGLLIENVGVKKLSHRFTNSKGQTEIMYYHRIIVNFKKWLTGNTFFLHILVNIPQVGSDLATYPKNFTGVYIIAYGIMGKVSNIDPDKVYDYHTAFDIKPTQVEYNVDINANNKKILNIALDKNQNNSAATVGMVKELIPFTTNYVYRQYFEEFYDFTDANIYGLSSTSSGVVFNSLVPNITFPNKHLVDIRKEGLNITNYTINFTPSGNFTNYTLCLVFYHWSKRDFALAKNDSQNRQGLLSVTFSKVAGYLTLLSNNKRKFFSLPSSFDGKKIVLWLAESVDSIVTTVNISNYSSTLTLATSNHTTNQYFDIITEDGVLSKIMFSPNFYDFDSEQFHKVMLQEKLNGSYIQ